MVLPSPVGESVAANFCGFYAYASCPASGPVYYLGRRGRLRYVPTRTHHWEKVG